MGVWEGRGMKWWEERGAKGGYQGDTKAIPTLKIARRYQGDTKAIAKAIPALKT